jgi:ubiquinone/menaquinone biosynthesis C-methylase UbiE
MKINLLRSLPLSWTKKPLRLRKKATINDRILTWKLGKEYFDGKRVQGYGGYKYDGRWKKVASDMIQYYKLKSYCKILDIGCAKGYLLEEFRKQLEKPTLCGIDISSYAITKSLKKEKFLTIANSTTLPFDDNYFDLVLSINSLHNILNLEQLTKSFKEIKRVAKKNIYITLGTYKNLNEKKNLDDWAVLATTYMSNRGWEKFFKKVNYNGDYWWFTAK